MVQTWDARFIGDTPSTPDPQTVDKRGEVPDTREAVPPVDIECADVRGCSFTYSFLPSPGIFTAVTLPPMPVVGPGTRVTVEGNVVELATTGTIFPAWLRAGDPSAAP